MTENDEFTADGAAEINRNLIINGQEATRGRYPYMASLAKRGSHRCGGTLITRDIVLTAAHCSNEFNQIQLGRHNINDRDEVFENFVIQEKVSHPRHAPENLGENYIDVDLFDFHLVKLWGRSDLEPVRVNLDPALPANAGDELWVMGWGSTDTSGKLGALSGLLHDVSVNYIPNDECSEIVGMTSTNKTVDYSQQIFGVNICAQDFTEGEDSCQGDSGGPLVIRGDGGDKPDVQVGVVSFGFESCAHEVFPGVYARLSYVDEWLREQVCSLSDFAPVEFDCPEKDLSFDEVDDDVEVTMSLRLDTRPYETGFIITSTNAAGNQVVYHSVPIGTFRHVEANRVMVDKIRLPNDRAYNLTMLDSGGNGMFDGSSRLGTLSLSDPTKVHYDGRLLQFSSWFTLPFEVGQVASSSPTQTPSPSLSPAPTPQPTNFGPYVATLVIRFDQKAGETGWRLEEKIAEDEYEVRRVQYPGSYHGEDFPDGEIYQETLRLQSGSTYRFVATDNEGNGICCNEGVGYYQLFTGVHEEAELAKNTLVPFFAVDRFNFEASVEWTVVPGEGWPTDQPPALGPTDFKASKGCVLDYARVLTSLVSILAIVMLG
eukprot:CAMPEP_0194047494 /NCGR_PEP_ID=MMETSP0009_2-20130614/24998_1 /TAXON_ID=210454 /ORGANISM="Grammatophora oceanica, Strain CCMP 410" /LENGTH=599 /DNA_ID=CAMNT_0038693143 /DNA_START=287 /DNA_END=2086 /DNA_ORIENTATION=-